MGISAINTTNVQQTSQVGNTSGVQSLDSSQLSAEASLPVPDDATGFAAVSPEALAALLIKMYGNDRRQSRTVAIKRESLAHEHGMKRVDEMNKAAELRATQTRWEAGLQVVGGSLKAAGALASIASFGGGGGSDKTDGPGGAGGGPEGPGGDNGDGPAKGADGKGKGSKLAKIGMPIGDAANTICVGAGRLIGTQPGLDAGHADAAAQREAMFAEEAKSQAERARDIAKTASKHVPEVIDFLRSIVETKHDTQKSAMLRA